MYPRRRADRRRAGAVADRPAYFAGRQVTRQPPRAPQRPTSQPHRTRSDATCAKPSPTAAAQSAYACETAASEQRASNPHSQASPLRKRGPKDASPA